MSRDFIDTPTAKADGSVKVETLQKYIIFLKEKQQAEKIEFVYGKGKKRKTDLQRATETLVKSGWLKKLFPTIFSNYGNDGTAATMGQVCFISKN